MGVATFVENQIGQIQQRGHSALASRVIWAVQVLPVCILAVPVVLLCRLIRPWFLVRWGGMVSARIGHFAGNTELYLCERDAGINRPRQHHVDLFYFGEQPPCNDQLATMWKRVLTIWPRWLLLPVRGVNYLIPGGAIHDIGDNTQADRDVLNLLDRSPPHLQFTREEEEKGAAGLRAMGIPPGATFVCLIVRDDAYLATEKPLVNWSYHDYRDSDIQNYVLAAEELATRGYVVIRMGARVRKGMKTAHERVIDYATNGMRSDFMDIYLGAKCEFCISVGTGFDAIPQIFRRPVVYVNMVPPGYFATYSRQYVGITKHHYSVEETRELTLREIFARGIGFFLWSDEYRKHGIRLVENSPEEIRDVVVEMVERLNGTWQPHGGDDDLQSRFWKIFPTDAVDTYAHGRALHGEIRSRFGAAFLRNNRAFLETPIQ
jgi:putative glycosyltransferase (TIGR04372 family)